MAKIIYDTNEKGYEACTIEYGENDKEVVPSFLIKIQDEQGNETVIDRWGNRKLRLSRLKSFQKEREKKEK